MLDEIDRKITRAMQGDFPLVEEPYKEIAAALAAECGLEERVMLYSVKEWKKTSMRYFCENEEGLA